MEILRVIFILILLVITTTATVSAEIEDNWFDPWEPLIDTSNDHNKSEEELLSEAISIMDHYPVAARRKLLTAIKKNPRSIIVLRYLGMYYSEKVRHHRLAIKYYKKAHQILLEDYGDPPYFQMRAAALHQQLLRDLSIARQNLDNYQLALDTLNEYEIYGYTDPYFASSKAWILFKLKRYDEAIEVAKRGLERGDNTLNILGILYSVTDQRQKAITTLTLAYEREKAYGSLGQPATPLNNVGEVFREIFQEEDAMRRWQIATGMHDGCEHILLYMNLSIVNIEALMLKQARSTIDSFKKCIALYPLRNNEEYKAISHLIHGRIDLYQGKLESAINNFKEGIERQQWFGKIGADVEDFQAAVYSSYAQALEIKSNHLSQSPTKDFWKKLELLQERIKLNILSKWYYRKAKLILTETLNDFEDVKVRHTDSMLDYPSLGTVFKEMPKTTTRRFIKKYLEKDHRAPSAIYYQAYLAENLVNKGSLKEGRKLLLEVMNDERSEFDVALKTHVQAVYLKTLNIEDENYSKLSFQVFSQLPSAIRNHGLKLIVNYEDMPSQLKEYLSQGPFLLDNDAKSPYRLIYKQHDEQHNLNLINQNSNSQISHTKGNDLYSLASKAIKKYFSNE